MTQRSVDFVQKRDFYRHRFAIPLPAIMRVSRLNDKVINQDKTTIVYVSNISAGGLSFSSELDIPIRKGDIRLQFILELAKQTFVVEGLLVRRTEYAGRNEIIYGVAFEIDSALERELVVAINQISIQNRI